MRDGGGSSHRHLVQSPLTYDGVVLDLHGEGWGAEHESGLWGLHDEV